MRYFDLTGMIGGKMLNDRWEAKLIAIEIARVEDRLRAGLPRKPDAAEINRCLTELKRVLDETARFMAARSK